LNEQKVADRSSRMDLRKNDDGSVDIYCGPKAPAGFEKNWIPTRLHLYCAGCAS
jgi:hypothetical protein